MRINYSDRSEEAFGLDPNHHRFPLKSRRFKIDAEAVARLPFGVPNRAARLERSQHRPDRETNSPTSSSISSSWSKPPKCLAAMKRCRRCFRRGKTRLRSWNGPRKRRTTLPASPRRANSRRSGSCRRIFRHRPPASTPRRGNRLRRARDALVAALKRLRRRYPQNGSLALTGHAHIDLAWLWPLAETRRKANRTFHTMIRLMDRYPDFRFNASTAQLYAYLEEDDPKLIAEIKKKVAAGQWEPIGAMWVEPDTNMPTAESLRAAAALRPALFREAVRQAPYGLLAARLLRLLAGAAAAPAARRNRELLHDQGELVGDQQDAVRPLLVGGPRRQPRARAHLQQPGRRLQRRDRPARDRTRHGGIFAESTSIRKACLPSATATAAAVRPRR